MRYTQPIVVVQQDNRRLWKVALVLFALPLVMLAFPLVGMFFLLRWVWKTGKTGRYIVTALLIATTILMVVGMMFGTA